MNRILQIPFDDLLYNQKEAGTRITDYCKDHAGATVTGATTYSDTLLVMIEMFNDADQKNYIIANAEADSYETLVSSIRSRHDAGFSTITTFTAGDQLWGLYSSQDKE